MALTVSGLWSGGFLVPVQSLFLLQPSGKGIITQLPSWLVVSLIFITAFGTGFAIERLGLHRAIFIIVILLLLWLSASILCSNFFQIDLVFAPIALSVVGTMLIVQAGRLWNIDALLAQDVRTVASQADTLEGGAANSRLVSGLRLLETVLPLDEAVIFHPDEEGNLTPAARLRQTSGSAADPQRNIAWREGVELCELAVKDKEVQAAPARGSNGANVAVPLYHAGKAVGALLVRLREPFDESDRPLLTAVGAQIARSFQRNETRKREWAKDLMSFISVRAAQHRLDGFGVVSGLLTEQRFGSQVISQTSDAQAIAYLDGTIASINEQMLRYVRMTEEQVRHSDIFGLLERFKNDYFDEPALAVRRVLQTGEPYARDLPYPEYSQTLAIRIALAKENTAEDATVVQPLCFAITVRDVTGIKEYERLKSDMVSLMSHELRTPITSINGFAELLALEDDIPESAREFVNIISSESQRLSRMIDAFLSLTKLEAKDKQEVLKAPVKLDDLAKEAVANAQNSARTKRIRLIEESDGRIPPVAADKSLISRVIGNMIDNAIKYSPERTTVTVSTMLEIDSVRVSVSDRGYGIPPEAVDRVWEKFYRVARDGMDKEEESTGLGLTYVKEVVERHGGEVSVESEVGKGSVFSFTLPRL